MVNRNDLDFEQISTFKDLQKIIKSNKFYSSVYFGVYEYECKKEDLYKYPFNKNSTILKFGNKDNCERKVIIEIYKDFFEVNPQFIIQPFKDKINNRNISPSYTLEQKIITILGEWRNYYLG